MTNYTYELLTLDEQRQHLEQHLRNAERDLFNSEVNVKKYAASLGELTSQTDRDEMQANVDASTRDVIISRNSAGVAKKLLAKCIADIEAAKAELPAAPE